MTGKLAIILLLILSGSSAAQPQAAIDASPRAVPINRQLRLTLELTWTGEADAYDVPPPDLSALTEFEVVERSLSTEHGNGANALTHVFILQPLKQGEFDVGRIQALYFEKDKDVPRRIPLPRTEVKVLPPELLPLRAKVGVGALVVVAIGAALAFSRKKKRGRLGSSPTALARDELSAKLGKAASLRVEGEFGAYMEELCEMAESEELRPHVGKLAELSEEIRFGGLVPSPDQLSWAEKKVRHAIRMAFPIEDESESD
jgi:hypothetical protein